MTYYTIPGISTTYYETFLISIRAWKGLADIGVKTWAKLMELGLISWSKLGEARCVTLYYLVSKPETTYYEVSE